MQIPSNLRERLVKNRWGPNYTLKLIICSNLYSLILRGYLYSISGWTVFRSKFNLMMVIYGWYNYISVSFYRIFLYLEFQIELLEYFYVHKYFHPFYNLWLCWTCFRVSTAFSTSSTMLLWPWYDVIQTLFIDIHKQVHLNLSMACEYRKRSIAQVYVQGRCTLSLPQVVIKQKSSWWWYITYYGNLRINGS